MISLGRGFSFLIFGLWLVFPASCNSSSSKSASSTIGGGTSGAPAIRLESVATGLSEPIGLFHAGDGSGRLFIIEQAGTIRILQNGTVGQTPFLDIRDRVSAGGERGLLGLAFHPKFEENGRLFVNYTSPTGGLHTVISEFKAGGGAADPGSERILLTIPQPFSNHNGGNIVFGPDGFLYIGMGDGGSGNDPQGNGQNLGTLLGKMLRIDVDQKASGKEYAIPPDNPFLGTSGAAPENWAYGLRNPWRFSFDSQTGLLYAGDVGQSAREEIHVIRKGGNNGWNPMEGTICTPGVNPDCDKSGYDLPIIDYPRSEGTTVVGGYVYRGSAIPNLPGAYLYGDFGSGRLWMLRYDGSAVSDQRLLLETGKNISSFGEDEQRELYLTDYGGEIFKIVSGQAT